MAIKLITGLKTAADIESEDDGARLYGTISGGDRILDVGNKWDYQIISNNSVRVKDGELLMQGRHVRQAPDTYTDLTINNGTQGLKRNDIIVARYTKNSGTSIENVELTVVEGTPDVTAVDPTLTTGDIFAGCEMHEMALYRVSLDGLNIDSVMALFTEFSSLEDHIQSVTKGGTGATTAAAARESLEVYKEYVLYSIASGSSSTITLSDAYTNYAEIGVYFISSGTISGFQKFTTSVTSGCACSLTYPDGGATLMYARAMLLAFSGTTLTFDRNYSARIKADSDMINEQLKVYKVVGFKY